MYGFGEDRDSDAKIGKRFDLLLERYGLTHQEVADKIGMNRVQIGHYLSKRNSIPNPVVLSLQQAYGLLPEWLLCGEGLMVRKTEDMMTMGVKDYVLSDMQRQLLRGFEHLNLRDKKLVLQLVKSLRRDRPSR